MVDKVFEPYVEAEKLNKQINKLISEYSIHTDNAKQWMLFSRTVQTSLEILNEVAKELILTKLTEGDNSEM